jgi:hypothetical protein
MATTPSLSDRRFRPADTASDLDAAGEQLLAAFASVPFDAGMWRCPHCVTDADVAALGEPVETLGPDLVARFVLKAGSTWGSPADLQRVAPQALVLAARGELPLDRGLLADKVRWAAWWRWPAPQVAALRVHQLADWGRLIRSDPRPAHTAHGWLRHLSRTGERLGPYLDDWHDALGPLTPRPHHLAAVRHLAVLLSASPLRPDVPETVYDLFPERLDAAEELAQWLTGPSTAHELHRAAGDLADTVDARRVTLAAERLRRFHLTLYEPPTDPADASEPADPAG